jgi:hypothetical protein
MSGCVIRAAGERFNVDEFLASSTFRPAAIHRRGAPRFPGVEANWVSNTSGFNLVVSDDDGDDQGVRQVADARAFIDRNRQELQRLSSRDDVDLWLDFGCFIREGMVAKFIRLPIEIVRECAALSIAIEVSVYAASPSTEVDC